MLRSLVGAQRQINRFHEYSRGYQRDGGQVLAKDSTRIDSNRCKHQAAQRKSRRSNVRTLPSVPVSLSPHHTIRRRFSRILHIVSIKFKVDYDTNTIDTHAHGKFPEYLDSVRIALDSSSRNDYRFDTSKHTCVYAYKRRHRRSPAQRPDWCVCVGVVCLFARGD